MADSATDRSTPAAYAAVLAAALLCYAALGVVLRILPQYVTGDLGGSAFAVGLSVGAPALTGVVARPIGGRIADRRGPVPVIVAGGVVMAAGVIPAFVHTLPALMVSRLAAGAGEGAMMAASVLWMLRLAGAERRGRAIGHIGLANYGGLVTGPLLAEALGAVAHPDRAFAAAVVLPLLGAGVALAASRRAPVPSAAGEEHARASGLWRATFRPGAGLLLVNVGYVALISFGATVVTAHGAGGASLIVPAFAAAVIIARTAGGSIPDRAGPVRTLLVCAPLEGAGLVMVQAAHGTIGVLAGAVVTAAGQALAVPALGLLALRRVEPRRHGAAAGLFFSWFDLGVGLGGAGVGLMASVTAPATALVAAAAAVACSAPIALVGRSVRRASGQTA